MLERFAHSEESLDEILAGNKEPGNVREAADFGELCLFKGLHLAGARLYLRAFETGGAAITADLERDHMYNAACAAAMASTGEGEDAIDLSEEERDRWRGKALEWLRASLALRREQISSDPATVQKRVTHWQGDSDLAAVRDEEALSKLPESERKEWQALWREVRKVLARTGEGGN